MNKKTSNILKGAVAVLAVAGDIWYRVSVKRSLKKLQKITKSLNEKQS